MSLSLRCISQRGNDDTIDLKTKCVDMSPNCNNHDTQEDVQVLRRQTDALTPRGAIGYAVVWFLFSTVC